VPPALYRLEKDGVLYEFSNNIYDSLKIPITDKDRIYEKLIMPNRVWMLFSADDNASAVAVAAASITAKVQYYNSYSLAKMIVFGTYELTNQSGENNLTVDELNGTLIEVRGPMLANETSVSLEGGIIVVQGTNYTQLSMAADRLTLVLFENELHALNVTIPE
jgi:hypothetical protein